MIPKEILKPILTEDPSRWYRSSRGWVSDGWIAAPQEPDEEWLRDFSLLDVDAEQKLFSVLAAQREECIERPEWRLPTRTENCPTCGGNGDLFGRDCPCYQCEGLGRVTVSLGQIVFDVPPNGRPVVIQGRYSPIVDRAALVVYWHVDPKCQGILTFGSDEAVEAIIMCMATGPVEPSPEAVVG